MNKHLFVDNSNVWLEGMKVSAVAKGMAPDVFHASEYRITDPSWRIDFGKLYQALNGTTIVQACLYGSTPPPNDSLWEKARQAGFHVHTFERSRLSTVQKHHKSGSLGFSVDLFYNKNNKLDLTF